MLAKQRAADEAVISTRECRIQSMLIPMSGTTRVIIGVIGTTSNVRGGFFAASVIGKVFWNYIPQ